MKSIVWVGVDISKNSFHAAYRQGAGFVEAEFLQQESSMQTFVEWLPTGKDVRIVLESTGPYWRPLVAFLHSLPRAIDCSVVNPRRVRDFARAAGQYSKTDPLDSRLLVHYGETFSPPALGAQRQAYQHLRALSRSSLQLRRHYDEIRDQRDKALADPQTPAHLAGYFESILKELEKQMEKMLGDIEQLLQRPTLREAALLLQSIPGVGVKTTATLLAELGPDALHYSIKQWQSFAGLDVIEWESGTSVRKRPRISKQGNWRIRRSLYLAALVATRYNPTLRTYYQHLLDQGKRKKAALVATMRKLLCICHGVLKNQTPFQEMPNSA